MYSDQGHAGEGDGHMIGLRDLNAVSEYRGCSSNGRAHLGSYPAFPSLPNKCKTKIGAYSNKDAAKWYT